MLVKKKINSILLFSGSHFSKAKGNDFSSFISLDIALKAYKISSQKPILYREEILDSETFNFYSFYDIFCGEALANITAKRCKNSLQKFSLFYLFLTVSL